ncbi:MAG: type VI secretion system baseplate subunit TssE [Saccharospirillum sp.]|nr:type VI secretion system baseplate subunit TssE [Saccharospirillum sp.]
MLSIYEVLSSQFQDGESAELRPDPHDRLKSIHDHLSRLLNARQGVLSHLPDYGLPDMNICYGNLPYSQNDLASQIKAVLEKYEPRLRRVQVTPLSRDYRNAVVRLEITGDVDGNGLVRFQTLFKSSTEAEVMPPTSA